MSFILVRYYVVAMIYIVKLGKALGLIDFVMLRTAMISATVPYICTLAHAIPFTRLAIAMAAQASKDNDSDRQNLRHTYQEFCQLK